MEKDRNKHELRKDMAIVVFLLPLILFVVYGIYKEQSSYFPLEDVSIQIGEDSIQNIPLWRNEENGIYYAFLPSETKQVCFDIPWDRNVTIGSETFESEASTSPATITGALSTRESLAGIVPIAV